MRKDNDYAFLDGLGEEIDVQSIEQGKKGDSEITKRLADTKRRLGVRQISGGETGFAVFEKLHPESKEDESLEEFNSEKEIKAGATCPLAQPSPDYEKPLDMTEWDKMGTIKNSSTGGGASLTPSRTPTEYRTDYKTTSEERTKGGFKINKTPKKAEYTSGDIVTQEDKDYTVMESPEPGKLKVKDEATGEEKIVSEELVEPKVATEEIKIGDPIYDKKTKQILVVSNIKKSDKEVTLVTILPTGEVVERKMTQIEPVRIETSKTADIQSVSFEDFWAIAAAPGSKAKKFKEFLIFMKDSLPEVTQKVVELNMGELKDKGLYDAISKSYKKWQVTQPAGAIEEIVKEPPSEEKAKEIVKETPIEDIFKEPSEVPISEQEEKPPLEPGMEASKKEGQAPSVPGSSAPVQEEHAKVTQRETEPSTTVVTDKEEPKQYLPPEEVQPEQKKPGVFEEFVNEIFTEPDVAVTIVKKMLDKAKTSPEILSRLESILPKVPSNPSSEFWKQNGKKLAMTIFFEIERMREV